MRWSSLALVGLVLTACGNGQPDAQRIADAQTRSFLGRTDQWKLDTALDRPRVQQMRDRSYSYCLSKRPSDEDCFNLQDHSLFEYANAFALVRIYRSEKNPAFPYARAHKETPAAFEQVYRYCRSVYDDAGARDARSLGPCMSAGVGADFFGVVPVP